LEVERNIGCLPPQLVSLNSPHNFSINPHRLTPHLPNLLYLQLFSQDYNAIPLPIIENKELPSWALYALEFFSALEKLESVTLEIVSDRKVLFKRDQNFVVSHAKKLLYQTGKWQKEGEIFMWKDVKSSGDIHRLKYDEKKREENEKMTEDLYNDEALRQAQEVLDMAAAEVAEENQQ
jgi:hypothetical protein